MFILRSESVLLFLRCVLKGKWTKTVIELRKCSTFWPISLQKFSEEYLWMWVMFATLLRSQDLLPVTFAINVHLLLLVWVVNQGKIVIFSFASGYFTKLWGQIGSCASSDCLKSHTTILICSVGEKNRLQKTTITISFDSFLVLLKPPKCRFSIFITSFN